MKSDRIALPENQLLAFLPAEVYQTLLPHLQPVFLARDLVLYKAYARIDYVYFPINCVLSALTIMENGDAIEVATVGTEGMVGQSAFAGAESSPNEVLVQIGGNCLRMTIETLKKEASREGPFRSVLHTYGTAFHAQVSQSVACNGLHTVPKRCCRWLLDTHDRVQDDVIPLTHEYLAFMLGVRRSTISEILQPLQAQGLIRGGRGEITVLDRKGMEAASCECYRNVKIAFDRLFASFTKRA